MQKSVRIIFSESSEKTYQELLHDKSKKARSLLRAIDIKCSILKQNIHYGQPISKKLFPKNYRIKNLFRIELPQFWRLFYRLNKVQENEIIVFILAILDHKEYNRLFRYKK